RHVPEGELTGIITDKFTESVYVLANEPSVALYRLQEHVRRSLPELAQHKADMQRWEEQSQGAIYTVEYACSAVKNLVDSSVYFRSVEGLLKQAISIRDHMNATAQGHRQLPLFISRWLVTSSRPFASVTEEFSHSAPRVLSSTVCLALGWVRGMQQ
uniref:BLOC-1 related complex subunit 8 n=1 Tax=Sus scrofa TaxID=9823 RepID=A0A5G2QN89_PIG